MKIKVSEMFESIQGEGRYVGVPMLFIRLYGCTRKCWFCDTKYSVVGDKYQEIGIDELIKKIKKSKLTCVCWTGGEPLLQRKAIKKVIDKTRERFHCLETNGDLLEDLDFFLFHYLAISPKELKIAEKVEKLCLKFNPEIWDIKVVTDLKRVGIDMLKFATALMPLSTGDEKKDKKIQQRVWNYCVKNGLRYSPRLQVEVWGLKTRKK
jgi:organic radical activating enzyme